jgi:hypothetical protein
MTKKLIGRVAVYSKPSKGIESDFISHTLFVCAKTGEFTDTKLRFGAQSNADSPDRAYAFKVENLPDLTDYDFPEAIALLAKLQKAMVREKAPRAILLDGKPYLDHCELARFLMGAEKLGLHVSRFDTWGAAYDWSRDLRSEELQNVVDSAPAYAS